jgi:peptide/nickel transport system substrate-binding protein/oligopeptide transport system substrate-binding protein
MLTALLYARPFQDEPPVSYVNSLGVVLPPDAAPPEEQEMEYFIVENTYMEWFRTVYKSSQAMHLIAEPLMRVNHHFDLVPAAATSWEVSEDGLMWTFYLRPDQVFSDGTPLTADDYVYTFRRGADPENAYDLEWYYRPIKNWADVIARKKPVTAIGVEALDDLTLRFTTEAPVPYFPYLIFYSWVSPRRAIEKYGDTWSTRPETFVSSGPFTLTEWHKASRMVLSLNQTYNGPARPYLERLIYKLYVVAAQPPVLPAYEANEIDFTGLSSQAQVDRIVNDPDMKDQLNQYTEFSTYYLTMDTYNSHFKDVRLRKAFAHAIDREALCRSALKHFGVPAYAMLPPGFPAESEAALTPLQKYNPDLARKYLAEAGYPDGKGFPTTELWLRNEGTVNRTAGEGIQAMIKRTLNIELELRNVETKVFMDALNSHRITLAMVPYEYDYLDPSNLLGLWMSNGRHAWKNETFEALVLRGNAFTGSREERLRIYQEAERILVDEAGGIFLWHPRVNQVWRPYLASHTLQPNKFGQRFWRQDKLQDLSTTIYIRKNQGRRLQSSPSLFKRLFPWL